MSDDAGRADALGQALRLRARAVAAAQRELIETIAAERAAAATLTARRDSIRGEIEAAGADDAGDDAVDMLGRWLREARAAESRAEAALTDAEAATSRQRAALAAARTAEASIAALIEARAAAAAERAGRRAQAALDEAGLRSHAASRRRDQDGLDTDGA